MKKRAFLAHGGRAFERLHNISCTFGSGRLELVAFVLDFIHSVLHFAHGRCLDAFAIIPLTVPAAENHNEP